MSEWSDLAGDRGVSRSALQSAVTDGALVLRNTITGTSGNCVTKSEALNFVWIKQNDASLVSRGSNDLVIKDDLVPSTCKILRVNIDFTDLSNSDDFKVGVSFVDCDGNSQTLYFDTPYLDYDTGYCFDSNNAVNLFIIQFSSPVAASFSSYIDGGYCDPSI